MTKMLTLRGAPAAFVGATRWYLTPWIAERDPDDRERCAVIALCQALVDAPCFISLDAGDEPPTQPQD
jgi:hypothetical protein